MNTPIFTYAFVRATTRDARHAARRRRRLGWAVASTLALIAASVVAARAADWQTTDRGVSPLAAWELGTCSGLRASGTIDDRRPIAVTVVRGNERMLFRCDPPGDGAWLAPVARVVRWAG